MNKKQFLYTGGHAFRISTGVEFTIPHFVMHCTNSTVVYVSESGEILSSEEFDNLPPMKAYFLRLTFPYPPIGEGEIIHVKNECRVEAVTPEIQHISIFSRRISVSAFCLHEEGMIYTQEFMPSFLQCDTECDKI